MDGELPLATFGAITERTSLTLFLLAHASQTSIGVSGSARPERAGDNWWTAREAEDDARALEEAPASSER